jgi:hypothetical protein
LKRKAQFPLNQHTTNGTVNVLATDWLALNALIAEAERCKQPGEIGALLRREGLYPLEGCVSAEPTSFSPDNSTIRDANTLNTQVMPKKSRGFRAGP